MKKSQNVLILAMIFFVISLICGIISYMDIEEWTGGYLAFFISLPLTVLFGIIAIILFILFMRTSYKEKELEVLGEKPVFVMKSKEILTWLIVCVVIGIVSGTLASLDLEGWITGRLMFFWGFPIAATFGITSLILFFRWSDRRREEETIIELSKIM